MSVPLLGKEKTLMSEFELTYGTMFDPPEELHTRFERALEEVSSTMGHEHPLVIDGEERYTAEKFTSNSPIDKNLVLGTFQKGTAQDAADAVAAARRAFPEWRDTPWKERVKIIRRAADLIEERVFTLAAMTSLEVGKNRMEALGDVAEAPALLRYACDEMERSQGYVMQMGQDPLPGYTATNISTLKPYGVWLVISPFNFPAALTGGPTGAALVAGNTVVMKPASDTPWVIRLLYDCFAEAGLPDGALNYLTGSGNVLGSALVENPDLDGLTFTGSYDVGMGIFRQFARGKYIRPAILELGGKNPAVVSRNADVERAALGIVRSAFGLQGQKCSACSRVYVEDPLYDKVVNCVIELTNELVIGDPTDRSVYLGPVINAPAQVKFQRYTAELQKSGTILTGGEILREGALEEGYFCQPTVVADVPFAHPLWKEEMFLPITMVQRVSSLDDAMRYANDVDYGLTAGFYGSLEEAQWFFNNIQAGVNYANRPQGATTGAWPGYQPFGGWKASGSSGKNAGGRHYLQLYMHEQVHTLIE
ncbi:MAG: aldehyde dehydrogenase family protein [Anaerolineales bacterium]